MMASCFCLTVWNLLIVFKSNLRWSHLPNFSFSPWHTNTWSPRNHQWKYSNSKLSMFGIFFFYSLKFLKNAVIFLCQNRKFLLYNLVTIMAKQANIFTFSPVITGMLQWCNLTFWALAQSGEQNRTFWDF